MRDRFQIIGGNSEHTPPLALQLQATPGSGCSAAARFTSPGPAWLSSDR